MKDQTKKLDIITQHLKRTEQVLHTGEEKYRRFVENTDCIILRMVARDNLNGTIVACTVSNKTETF